MKRVFICFLLMAAHLAFAQNSVALNDGMNFGHSIAPTSNRQIVNPGAVNAQAWSGNTAAPTTAPAGLGGFSTPKTDTSVYNTATIGGLTGLGNKAQIDCQGFTPGNDPLRNQECAAVNFLSNKCITPSSGQASILGSFGNSQLAQSAACEGSYGKGTQQFNFNDQVTQSDSIFDSMRGLKSKAASASEQVCTEKTVITEPAAFEFNTCVKSSTTEAVSCSQYLNMSVTTSKEAATATNSCKDGVLVGNFCQKSSTGAASPVYACPAGATLSGTNCLQSTSISAKPNYYCAAGSTLSGLNCVSVNNTTTPALIASYSCPAGATSSGANCLTTTSTAAAIATYSCPVGQSLSGSTCVQTLVTTNGGAANYPCPAGTTLSGSNCISTSNYTASPIYSCASGALSGSNCIVSKTTGAIYACPSTHVIHFTGVRNVCLTTAFTQSYPYNGGPDYAQDDYSYNSGFYGGPEYYYDGYSYEDYAPVVGYATPLSCPSGQTLSGNSCLSTSTTQATISSYACPSGGTVSSGRCVTTTATSATVSYSCPAGQTLSGSNCTQTTTTTSAATPAYACAAGYLLSGTTCSKTTSTSAMANYSCPTGSTLSGSNCTSSNNVTTTATVASYSCPLGATLSGSNCLTASTTPATVNSYSCPATATLQGATCITTATTPASINYSCIDGSAPVAGLCIYRSAKTSWTNTCGALEASAGVALKIPN